MNEATNKRPRGRPKQALGDANQRTSTRDALIREGIKTWASEGWAAVGLQQLLERCEVPKGSFYHYFESKEAFGLAVIETYAGLIEKRFASAPLNATVPQQLSHFIDVGRQGLLRGSFRYGCLVGNLGQELGATDTPLRPALDALLLDWEQRLATLLDEGVRAGAYPETLDTQLASRHFWSGWEGALFRAKLSRSIRPLDEFEMVLNRLLVAGIPPKRLSTP